MCNRGEKHDSVVWNLVGEDGLEQDSCLPEPQTAASGREDHSMQAAEEIKQINVSLRVGLITEGPSITITNSPPTHPSAAPPPLL